MKNIVTNTRLIPISIALFFIIGLSACQGNGKSSENSKSSRLVEKQIPYKIISEKKHVDLEHGFNKCNLEIRLNQKIDKDELKKIALSLRKTRSTYKYLWIFYYLPDTKVGSGAWATTHFTPDLEVKILGATSKQEQTALELSNKIKGKIIGKWREKQYTSAVYVIYKNENDIMLKTIYPNSQQSDDKLTKKQEGNKIRYDYANGGYNGEYFVVNEKNELEFYNKSGKLFTKGSSVK